MNSIYRDKIDKFGVMLGELLGVDEIGFVDPDEPREPETKTVHITIEKQEKKKKTFTLKLRAFIFKKVVHKFFSRTRIA